jgi:beta-phosphoglucomutase
MKYRRAKKLFIFDFDGTIADTSLLNYHSYKAAFKVFNVKLSLKEYIMIFNGKDFFRVLKHLDIKIRKNASKVHLLKKQNYKKYLNKIKPNELIISLIKSLSKENYVSVVSTASRENLHSALKYLDLFKFIHLIVSKEDVKKTKPDPEGFNKAVRYFNINKKNCIIFEDSSVGINAAIRSKIQYCKVFSL